MSDRTATTDLERTFAAWLAEHGAIVVRTARAFARGADRDDVEQELLLAIWRSIPAFRGGSSVATFLYRVTHNAALTWRRDERARNFRDRQVALEIARTGAVASLPAAGDDDDERRLDRLYDAIRELPPLDRSLLLLSLDGVPYAEMSALHGLTPTHVGARLTRARQRLASRLEGEHR